MINYNINYSPFFDLVDNLIGQGGGKRYLNTFGVRSFSAKSGVPWAEKATQNVLMKAWHANAY